MQALPSDNEGSDRKTRFPASSFTEKLVKESSTNCDRYSSSATSSLYNETIIKSISDLPFVGLCHWFCFLDFGFVVVGGGGGVAVVNDGDDCDEMRERS